jgi:3-hydroxy acid dehydrogenase / malonic semialdehyde reductase
MTDKTVFITGATSGFGKACAEKYAANKYRLILNGRRTERLEELKKELENKYKAVIHLLPFDVQNREAVFAAVESLPAEWKTVDILINNAGLALGRDYFEEANLTDWETMIDTNVKGLLYVSKAAIPLLLKSKQPHIVNLGSIAGKEVYEKGNVYCASKYAVEAISKSLRIDLLRHAVKVTAIHPGAADTEFSLVRFAGDKEKADNMYKGYTPLYADNIADAIYYCTSLPAHVCINELEITCTSQANSYYYYKISS